MYTTIHEPCKWRLAYHVFFLNIWNCQHCNIYPNINWSFWKKKNWRSSCARSVAPAWRIKYVKKSPVGNFLPFISQRRRIVPEYNNKRDNNSFIVFDNRKWRVRHTLYYVSYLRHLHISHNAPYLRPPTTPCKKKKLHNRFTFLLGITAAPREFENNAYAKFWRANNVYYGVCASGV